MCLLWGFLRVPGDDGPHETLLAVAEPGRGAQTPQL